MGGARTGLEEHGEAVTPEDPWMALLYVSVLDGIARVSGMFNYPAKIYPYRLSCTYVCTSVRLLLGVHSVAQV